MILLGGLLIFIFHKCDIKDLSYEIIYFTLLYLLVT